MNAWFEYWIEHIVGDLSPNAVGKYRERYEHNSKPIIGNIQLSSVKPLHCKMVFNQMEPNYTGSTIRSAYITMGTIYKSALMNDLIVKHPMNGVRYTKPTCAVNDVRYLS